MTEVAQDKASQLADEINQKEAENKKEPTLQEKAGQALDDAKAKVAETYEAVVGKLDAAGDVAKEKAEKVGDEVNEKEKGSKD